MSASDDGERFVVLAANLNANGIVNVDAVAMCDEMEAHAVAGLVMSLGQRAYFINTKGEDGHPTIDRYLDDDTSDADEVDQ